MIDAAHRLIAGALNLGLFVFFRQPLLERFDALSDIPHDVGNLALAAENEQHDRPDNEPMPNRQTAHGGNLLISCETAQSRPPWRKPRLSEAQKQEGLAPFRAIRSHQVGLYRPGQGCSTAKHMISVPLRSGFPKNHRTKTKVYRFLAFGPNAPI